ncbi:MAG: glycosyltransferase family 4 protein [Nitrosospira sp.]|nr:glycosyltransferase family 4 protein [Nitrosospira sp.]
MIPGPFLISVAPPLLAFIVTLALTKWLIKSKIFEVLDYPNLRSLHTKPIPRTGGLALVLGILVSWTILPTALAAPIWIAVTLLASVSFADDIFGLPAPVRLLMHGAVALWFSAALLPGTNSWMIVAITAIAVAWMINLYNFMDGSDGLAGGMTLIGFSCYGMAAWLNANELFAMINFCIASSAAAFLLFNFHPARIFLGDTGSIPLGFLAAALGMTGWINGYWPAWLPLLVFSPFIADASVTLAKRSLRREKIWQAHREHYYQRMVQNGLGHRNTALLAYILMLASGASALWAMREDSAVQLVVGIAWCGIYLVLMLAYDRYLARNPCNS